ncbi:MAG: C10 family peptidase [Salinivirgaceae bacterium]|nr:C10 family peptidase [Salinivirgaceae bacterium]
MAKAKNATEGNSSITNQTNNSTSDSGIVSSSNSANTINIIQYVHKIRGYTYLNKELCFNGNLFYIEREKENCNKVFLTSEWNQTWPYNAFRKKKINDNTSPSNNKRNPAGCIYIALGQLFYYYRYYNKVQNRFPSITRLFEKYKYDAQSDTTTAYKNGNPYKSYNLQDLKSLMYRLKRFIDFKFSLAKGSSGIPRESELKNVLKKMRCNKHWTSNEKTAELLYEAIVINQIPVLVWVQLDYKIWTGHFLIIDGCKVNRNILESKQSFNAACEFHYNYGWGGSNDDWYNTWDGLRPNSHHFNKYRRLYFYAPETIMVKKADNNSAPPLISDLKYPKI